MDQQIIEKLQWIEKEKGIQILYACESGSRAWGFASPDSDYDIRFIYIRPENWYLSIFNKKDFLDFAMMGDLDFGGWDLKKGLALAFKSNAVIFEWFNSPVIYVNKGNFRTEFSELIRPFFDPSRARHHYLGLAIKSAEKAFSEKEIHLKKCFYALRPLLAANYIVKNHKIPPIEFHLLASQVKEASIREEINFLLDKKAETGEKGTIPYFGKVKTYFYDHNKTLFDYKFPEKEAISPDTLNGFFINTVRNDY